jgi:hypothetical protein
MYTFIFYTKPPCHKKEEDTKLEEVYPDPPEYPNPYTTLNPLFIRFLQSLVVLHEYYHKRKVRIEDILKLFV